MLWNVLAIENTKIMRRWMLWIEIGVLAAMVLGLNLLLYTARFTVQQTPQAVPADEIAALDQMLTWPEALTSATTFSAGTGLGGMLVIILVAAVTAQEYTWRTLHLWLSHGTPRPVLLGAKFAALLLPLLLFVLIPVLVSAPLTAFFSVQITGSLDASQIDLGQLALSILRTTYTMLPYVALTFMLAIVSRSTVAAIGIGLGYTLLIEGLLIQLLSLASGVFAQVWKYLPAGLVTSVIHLNSATSAHLTVNGQSATLTPLDPNAAALGIALYTLAFLAVALIAFRRQDLTG